MGSEHPPRCLLPDGFFATPQKWIKALRYMPPFLLLERDWHPDQDRGVRALQHGDEAVMMANGKAEAMGLLPELLAVCLVVQRWWVNES